MSCKYCVNGKIELFTNTVDCLECQPAQKYPELADGRFFWIDSKRAFELPAGTWWKVSSGGWSVSNMHTVVGDRTKHLYALPGPEPKPGDVHGAEPPVLDRPPFGAWGDRFYFLEEGAFAYVGVRGEWLDFSHYSRESPLSAVIEFIRETDRLNVAEHGHTNQEYLDWLEAQR